MLRGFKWYVILVCDMCGSYKAFIMLGCSVSCTFVFYNAVTVTILLGYNYKAVVLIKTAYDFLDYTQYLFVGSKRLLTKHHSLGSSFKILHPWLTNCIPCPLAWGRIAPTMLKLCYQIFKRTVLFHQFSNRMYIHI